MDTILVVMHNLFEQNSKCKSCEPGHPRKKWGA